MYTFTTTEQYYKDFFQTLFTDTLSQAIIQSYDFVEEDEENLILRILVDNTRNNQLPELTLEKDGIEKFAGWVGIPEIMDSKYTLEIQLKSPGGTTPQVHHTQGWTIKYIN